LTARPHRSILKGASPRFSWVLPVLPRLAPGLTVPAHLVALVMTANSRRGPDGVPQALPCSLFRVLAGSSLFFLSLFLLGGCSLGYLLHVGQGQFRILLGRERVDDLLRDGKLSAAEAEKVKIVLEAKAFGEEALGLAVSRNYTCFYRVEGDRHLAFNLTASPRLELEARQWCFPVVGCLPYKGFFSRDKALGEEGRLAAEGWDTYLRPVAAYSTLGWFVDPIFSTMLAYDEATLVEIVLHEMVHRTIFVKNQGAFNEGTATFIGEKGTLAFFHSRSPDSVTAEFQARLEGKWREGRAFEARMRALAERLRGLYGSDLEEEGKLRKREECFDQEKASLEESLDPDRRSAYTGILRRPWNNALLVSYLTYHQDFSFWEAVYERCEKDLRAMVARLKGLEGDPDPMARIRAWLAEDGPAGELAD